MTVYADETFYTGTYLQGRNAVITAAFAFYARAASAEITAYAGREFPEDALPEAVQMCCCEIAEQLCTAETSEAARKAGIASESVQGWSQSYESSESRTQAQRRAMTDTLHKWLDALLSETSTRIGPNRRWRQCW
jgi:hypothetical protein